MARFKSKDILLVGLKGDSPYIGKNGNWWIGDKDTGVSASGGSGEVDSELSTESENPVQNKVVTEALDDKVQKNTSFNSYMKVYGQTSNGEERMYEFAFSPKSGNLAFYDYSDLGGYDNNGNIITYNTGAVPTVIPSKPTHATPKKWVEDNFVKVLKGEGKPTTETVGELNQFYLDLNKNVYYQCTAIKDGAYTWSCVVTLANVSAAWGIKYTAHNPPYLTIAPGNKSTYDARKDTYNTPVTASWINYAVMLGLTEPTVGERPVEWTDEQKALARQTIGATKLYKHTAILNADPDPNGGLDYRIQYYSLSAETNKIMVFGNYIEIEDEYIISVPAIAGTMNGVEGCKFCESMSPWIFGGSNNDHRFIYAISLYEYITDGVEITWSISENVEEV